MPFATSVRVLGVSVSLHAAYSAAATSPGIDLPLTSPMSCIASDVGVPVLLRSSCSSLENDLHSGPDSSTRSVRTNPQPPQNISPVVLSVTMGPFPQRGHRPPEPKVSRVISYKNFG